mmetsp:Transcript_23742/g.35646  ORF Transcript_23742/g.35646 Transcript_23742/m.35646 type:complete len:406 (-) Transcript_23742:592-1809(-)
MPEGTLHQLVRLRSWEDLDHHLQHTCTQQHKKDCSNTVSAMDAQYFVNNRGETVLHLASAFGAPLKTMRLLHKACPEQITKQTNQGMTPLHYACYVGAAFLKIRFLLTEHPGAVLAKDNSGMTPLTLLWVIHVWPSKIVEDMDAEKKRVEQNIRDMMSARGKQDLVGVLGSWWRKIELMLRCTAQLTLDTREGENCKWRCIHALAAVNCNPRLLRFAVKIFPEQVEERDERGRLPLHIACRKTCAYNLEPADLNQNDGDLNASSSCTSSDCNGQANEKLFPTELISILNPLLESHPQSASIPDKAGRLPLHLAIVRGRSWHSGVELLFRAAPDVISKRDVETGLYPFQLALASKKSDLTTAYRLLRASPTLIQSGIGQGIRKRRCSRRLVDQRRVKKCCRKTGAV